MTRHADDANDGVVLRALLLLLSLMMAVPAAAMPACHEAQAAPAHAMAGKPHRAPEQAPQHACVGCVPLADWMAERIAPPRLMPAAAPIPRIVTLDLVRASPPPLRPPRLN